MCERGVVAHKLDGTFTGLLSLELLSSLLAKTILVSDLSLGGCDLHLVCSDIEEVVWLLLDWGAGGVVLQRENISDRWTPDPHFQEGRFGITFSTRAAALAMR